MDWTISNGLHKICFKNTFSLQEMYLNVIFFLAKLNEN